MIPNEGKFRYSFDKGKTWLHDNYYAPFDFAVSKTTRQIEEEKAEINRLSKPYYLVDSKLGFNKSQSIITDLDTFVERVSGMHVQEYLPRSNDKTSIIEKGGEWIEEIYSKGIIQHVVADSIPSGLLVEVKNSVAREKLITDFFTPNEAVEFIAQKLYNSDKWKDAELKIFFEKFLVPNIVFSDKLTRAAKQKAIGSISLSRGMVSEGELIIAKGEIITPEKFNILSSVKAEFESRLGSFRISTIWVIVGQFSIVTMLLAMLLLFLVLLRKDIFEDTIQLSFLFSLIVAEVVLAELMVLKAPVSIYLFPFCIMPIIIRAFFDTRLALFAHMLVMLIIGFIVPNPFEFFVIQMLGGIACIFSIVSMRKRSQLFITITLLTVAYMLSYSAIILLTEGQISAIEWIDLAWLAGSASLTLFSYPIIYFIEKVFGFTSDVSLLELSDTNNPLLKELALRAPGTFQHSLQVANLAEAAVYRIGGNTLLTRTGALYHDVGKMELARYFIENQMTQVNPHDELGFDESASIIISHVKHGIVLGRKNHLPEKIIDFIRTHHGNSRVQYFYRSFLKNFPEADVDEGAFRYPGPIPFSRETAIVMMADAVEATSRSLKIANSETIDSMVESIINQQIEDNQFINADITFKDITVIKKIFKKMLMNIYHVRVEYPK